MKKVFLGMAAVALLFTACDNNESTSIQEQEIDMSDFYVYTDSDVDEASRSALTKGKSKSCHTMVLLNKELKQNPGLEKKMYDIEYHTRKLIAAKKPDGVGNGNGGGNNGGGGDPPFEGDITIPVYVHIIYQNDINYINQSQIDSQIDVLNADFSNTNSDIGNVASSGFADVLGNANIQFTLAGVTKTQNSKSSWAINNDMKYQSSGGRDAISPETHLNIWVVNLFTGNGTLGFAYLPGTAPAGADGVVIASPYFGDEGTAGSIYPEFGLGRTTTHEVGHYLNMRHIWGDGRCKQDDLVADTPSSDRENYGCPSSAYHCRSNDMHMNYMDYVNDACMYMFSQGQVDRMRALFATGGERESLLGS